MKFLKFNLLFIFAAVILLSCSSDDDFTPNNIEETENLHLVKTFTDSGYTLELFSEFRQLRVGYNPLYIRLTDADGVYVEDASINWMPMMTMHMDEMTHKHSSPFSDIKKAEGKSTLFEGYIVFIMASDEPDHYWDLGIDFNVDGQSFSINEKINVISTDSPYSKVYTSGMGSDEENYMLALVAPTDPIIGTNDIVVALFKMGEEHNFPIVHDYKIKVDPRMPGMGNHSAPGNEEMTQGEDGLYHGKVGFSMSGYWKINLILEDASGTVVKGEPVTEENEDSSLHFKLEF